jgi:Sec-independent protein translocase protein TatA
LGKSLTEFRRASEDFKRTWEREVNLDHVDQPGQSGMHSILDKATDRLRAAREAAALDSNPSEQLASVVTPSVTAVDPALVQPREAKVAPETVAPETAALETTPADQPPSKHDWL